MIESTSESRSNEFAPKWATRFAIAILFLVSLISLYWSIHCAVVRIGLRYPQSPWESEILVDGWRAIHHHRIYTDAATGHATHMYGPLITFLVGACISVVGFHISIGRWIALISALSMSMGIAVALGKRKPLLTFLAFAILVSHFYRARGYIAETRPDAMATAIGALSLWFFYRALQNTIWLYEAAAIVTMLVGFGFKQPTAMVAGVPIVSMLLNRTRPSLMQLLMATLPLAVMAVVTLFIFLFAPNLYFYMFTVATRFPMRPELWVPTLVNLLTYDTAFVVMFTLWLTRSDLSIWSKNAMSWLLATVIVSGLSSSLAFAKQGGAINSELPAFLAMSVFALAVLNKVLVTRREQFRSAWVKPAVILLAASCVFADTNVPLQPTFFIPGTRNGDATYPRVIDRAKTLPGSVLCMDDPTITLQSKGQLCRSVMCEKDVFGQPATLPSYVMSDLRKGNYVIRVDGSLPSRLTDEFLNECGYARVTREKLFQGPVYTLWERRAPSTQPRHPAKDPATTRSSD